MRILYVTNGITGSGGLERVLSVKASMLAEDFGYEVHIISLNEPGKETFFEFDPRVIRHSITVTGNPFCYVKSYVRNIKKKIASIEPDIISVCDDGLKGFFLPHILGSKIPLIYERHVSKQIEAGAGRGLRRRLLTRCKWALMEKLAANFSKFIVLTEGNRKEWRSLKNLEVIPNPLPFLPENGADLSARNIIAVGKQSYQKGYDLLLTSWSLIKDEVKSKWELHVFGRKDPAIGLEELAERLGVSETVFFHGPRINIGDSYKNSSIFVLSSRFEGFGMVIIEAMAYGLPVVSFDCPYGPADIINDGYDGYLITNGDLVLFAEKLEALMKSEELRTQFGSTGKASVQKYSTKKIISIWNDLFINLTKSRNFKKN